MVFSKVKLSSLSLLLTPFMCFNVLANNDAAEDTIVERIPTEELVEGIKSSDGRWFEVEMIIFERNDDQDVREQFSTEVQSMTHGNQWDLIREVLQPNISLPLSNLPECHVDKNPLLNIEPTPEPIEFTEALNADPIITTPIVFEPSVEETLDVQTTDINAIETSGVIPSLNNQISDESQLTDDISSETFTVKVISDEDIEAYKAADNFYKNVQNFKKLINQNWQFTNELCLLPSESLSGYWQLDNDLPLLTEQELTNVPIDSIPSVITGGDHDDLHDVYLIAEQNLGLKEQYYTLKKHPKLNPIAHLGWRQPGLSKRRARPVYIVAGENLSDQFRYDGSEIIKPKSEKIDISDYLSEDLLQPQTDVDKNTDMILDSLFENTPQLAATELMQTEQQDNLSKFMSQLESGAVVDFRNSQLVYPEQSSLPQQTFKLDGYVKVHLNHYLFVDAQFNYREKHSEQVELSDFINENEESYVTDTDDIVITEMAPDTIVNADSAIPTDNAENQAVELVTVNYLKNYSFKQDRRFYSGDLHYLDHPKFGILIQIRKYRH